LASEVRSQLRALPSYDVPGGVLGAVLRRTVSDRAADRPARSALPRRAFWLAAAAVLVLAISGVLWRGTPGPSDWTTEATVERATEQARFAFALVGAATRQTDIDRLLREGVLAPTVSGLSQSIRDGLVRAMTDDSSEPEPTATRTGGVS